MNTGIRGIGKGGLSRLNRSSRLNGFEEALTSYFSVGYTSESMHKIDFNRTLRMFVDAESS